MPRFAVATFDDAEPRIASWYRDLRVSRKVNIRDAVSETILFARPFRLRKVTTDCEILADVGAVSG